MTIHQYPGSMNRLAIQAAMKPTERIVCTNATVVMDAVTERISYFDNDTPVGVIETGDPDDPIIRERLGPHPLRPVPHGGRQR